MRILSWEEAIEMNRAWGIADNELVITFVGSSKPAPPEDLSEDEPPVPEDSPADGDGATEGDA